MVVLNHLFKKKEERSHRVSKKERLKIRCYKEEEGTREPEEVNTLGVGGWVEESTDGITAINVY